MKRPVVRALDGAIPANAGQARRLNPSAVRRPPSALRLPSSAFPPAFTLIEVLVATVLSLIIMAAVVTVFASITTSISQSRTTLEMTDRLRTTASQLKRDLEGVTVTMLPPRRPETNEGYFEYIEGPVGAVFPPESPYLWDSSSQQYDIPLKWPGGSNPAISGATQPQPYAFDLDRTTGATGVADTTIGDNDDILMFTTRAKDRPFVGRCGGAATTIESWVAEVAWFVRGRTLYRRVLLVAPNAFTSSSNLTPSGYYANYDISAHVIAQGTTTVVVPNSLGDLTKRENRFAHPYSAGFPYDVRVWGQLGLPTLRETCAVNSTTPFTLLPGSNTNLPNLPSFMARDFWTNPYPWTSYMSASAPDTQSVYYDASVTRLTDDVVMTNVVGFDVKVWDPGAPVFQYTAGNGTVVTVMPGDPYYIKALNNVSANSPPAYYGAYVDLGWDQPATVTTSPISNKSVYAYPYATKRAQYLAGSPLPNFGHLGEGYVVNKNSNNTNVYLGNAYLGKSGSGLVVTVPASNVPLAYTSARVYDTYSLHYEYDGIAQYGAAVPDLGTNGADDYDGIQTNSQLNGADDPGEAETCPPYPSPLRGIQVKIRCMDPDSGQVREMTVVQEFLPQ